MRKARVVEAVLAGAFALSLMLVPGLAMAQERPISVSLGPIAVGPMSGTYRQFNIGFGGDVGLTIKLREQTAIRFDYVMSALSGKNPPQFPASVPVDAKMKLQWGTLDFVYRAPSEEKMRLNVMAGVGVYRRSVDVSTAATGPVTACNPWWFACFPAAVSADRMNATRAVTNVGLNVGVGVTYKFMFAELRFHYVWGPEFATASGPVKATGRFFPLVIGVRY